MTEKEQNQPREEARGAECRELPASREASGRPPPMGSDSAQRRSGVRSQCAQSMSPGAHPGLGVQRFYWDAHRWGVAAAWPTFVSSRSEGHGPKAPTGNQSLGCPVWSRLLQVNKDPQQTGCSEGLESPRESRAKASPASCGQVRPPLRLSMHSQAGAPGEQGRGASSSRAAEKSLRVLE